VIRSHRRDERGRRIAFRVLTAVIVSGSGLGIAMITASGSEAPASTPNRTSDEVSRGHLRIPDDLSQTFAVPTPSTPPATTSAAAPTTTQPRLAARGSGSGAGTGGALTSVPSQPAPTTKSPTPAPTTAAPTSPSPVPTTPSPAPTSPAPSPTSPAPSPTSPAPSPTSPAPSPT